MEIIITPRNVMTVVIEVDRMLRDSSQNKHMNLNQAEVMIGLQELVGRIIVDMAATQVSAEELVKHAKQHLDNTITIGMRTKGQTVGQA